MSTVRHNSLMTRADKEMNAQHETERLTMVAYLNDDIAHNEGRVLKW